MNATLKAINERQSRIDALHAEALQSLRNFVASNGLVTGYRQQAEDRLAVLGINTDGCEGVSGAKHLIAHLMGMGVR